MISLILALSGDFLLFFGGLMLSLGLFELVANSGQYNILISGFICLFFGGAFRIAGKKEKVTPQSILASIVFLWILIPLFSSLPIFLSYETDVSLIQAFFEATSGITTTGATIFARPEDLPTSLLLWRAILQWIGGIGIVVILTTLFPLLRIGGMQLFVVEGLSQQVKFAPKLIQIAYSIIAIYSVLTMLCFIGLLIGGMSAFDALIHAMTTISTGGFSTSSESISAFSNPIIDSVIICFMILGSMPFLFFNQLFRGRSFKEIETSQILLFLGLILLTVIASVLWLFYSENFNLTDAIRLGAFNTISVLTGTGFKTADYSNWGSFILCMFFFLSFIGGCSGSTSCGVKIFHIQILLKSMKTFATKAFFPRKITSETYNKREVNADVKNAINSMLASFVILFLILSLSLYASGKLLDNLVHCRKNGEFVLVPPEQADYIDISPKQVISISASLIPFLENDDANRALMGSNMQRQAVPIIKPKAPFVGTGMEGVVARDSGVNTAAKRDGTVKYVDSRRIVVQSHRDNFSQIGVDVYRLDKFKRSNSGTCINQKPLVVVGDKVTKGDIMSDGSCMDMGELALGSNVLVAFASYKGYNFEDAIVISRRLVRDDVFTSIHIQEFTCTARDTKLGPEEVTRHIPNVGEEALSHLDESGIVYIGSKVKEGDILVGKVIPKGETIVTPEEKLLRTIFGQRVAEVKDISLRVPPGVSGTVVGVSILNRQGIEKDGRTQALEMEYIRELQDDAEDIKRVYEKDVYGRLEKLLKDSGVDSTSLKNKPRDEWWKIKIKDKKAASNLEALHAQFEKAMHDLEANVKNKMSKIQQGHSLVPGVLKMIHVYLATRRNLQPGDKMAGRHGNKGVVSVVLPEEDMPYSEDGTPVDMILNPLGVPSRMNVGQILETHLGWAAKGLGRKIGEIASKATSKKELLDFLKDIYSEEEYKQVEKMSEKEIKDLAHNLSDGVPMATPVFEGMKEKDIVKYLEKAGLDSSGQVTLYDGCTGEVMDRKATVGYIYMLKLHHLVDDKMHARSTGPYSLVTQQPLGGKSQFGGQRLGEMEVWALQGHGAAYNVMEMLTVKSDDVKGRNDMFSSIVRGYPELSHNMPESFNVLVKEIRSLALDINLMNKEE